MLPKLLATRLELLLGEDSAGVMATFANERLSSFRVNTLKSTVEQVEAECLKLGFPIEKMAEIPHAYLLDRSHEYALKGSSLFREGMIYLQSLSSMLPVLSLAPKSGESVLDICAAPGSKTTQIAAQMDNVGSITALEQNAIRLDILNHNLALQGATIVTTLKADARYFLSSTATLGWHQKEGITEPMKPQKYNAIILDAPCSAE